MKTKLAVVFVLFAIVLAACGSRTEEAQSLEYASDADTLVIYADEITTAGGFALGQECNHIPRLRIWGDGRTIYSDIIDGKRRVLVGQTAPEQIKALLQKLDDAQYFTNPPESSFNGAGSGYRLGINLESGDHNSFWTEPNAVYQAMMDAFDPASLAEFQPEEGHLVVGPILRKDLFAEAPAWPADFGFRLSDPDASDRTVTGPALDFLWQAVNDHPEPLTGVLDGDSVYAVAVFVEGISLGEPPFRCWNK